MNKNKEGLWIKSGLNKMKNFITRSECANNHLNLNKKMDDIYNELEKIKIELAKLPEKLGEQFDKKYVTLEAFKPVQKLAYGLVGAVLLGVLIALLALVIK